MRLSDCNPGDAVWFPERPWIRVNERAPSQVARVVNVIDGMAWVRFLEGMGPLGMVCRILNDERVEKLPPMGEQ